MQIQQILSFEYQQPEAGFLHHGGSYDHWQLVYCLCGHVHAVVEGHPLLLKPGAVLLSAPQQFSMLYAQEDNAPSFVTIGFQAQGLSPEKLAGKIIPMQDSQNILLQMTQEHTQPDAFSQALIFHLLSLLLLRLSRDAAALPSPQAPTKLQRGENDIIRRAQKHISTHIQEKLSVTLVASRIDVSPSYLTALFHKHLAIAPGEYIRRAKLQESKRLIQESNLNFTEIAAALEYSTVHHFSRQFKEHFGMTPTDYAKIVGTKGN